MRQEKRRVCWSVAHGAAGKIEYDFADAVVYAIPVFIEFHLRGRPYQYIICPKCFKRFQLVFFLVFLFVYTIRFSQRPPASMTVEDEHCRFDTAVPEADYQRKTHSVTCVHLPGSARIWIVLDFAISFLFTFFFGAFAWVVPSDASLLQQDIVLYAARAFHLAVRSFGKARVPPPPPCLTPGHTTKRENDTDTRLATPTQMTNKQLFGGGDFCMNE